MSTGGLRAEMEVRRAGSFRLALELSIPPGTTTALLGPNAAGKSTAVAALAGLLPLERGRVELAGRLLEDPAAGVSVPAEERRIGVVFQDGLLFPHMSARENVAFGLRSRSVPRQDARSRADAWLERLGLSGLEDRRPGELSGGQAQRVALARALVVEPDLLLLDEPLSALDVTTRTRLRETLAEHLEAFDGPRLLITHDPTEAFLLADRICVLEDGAVTQEGTADEIRLRPRTRYAADLAGSNLLRGTASDGRVDVEGHVLHVADHDVKGPVLATVHPTAVSVHRGRPEGSPRNAWATRVDRIVALGDRARLRTGPPLPLTVEITREAREELALEDGTDIWVAIKATEIGVRSGSAGA